MYVISSSYCWGISCKLLTANNGLIDWFYRIQNHITLSILQLKEWKIIEEKNMCPWTKHKLPYKKLIMVSTNNLVPGQGAQTHFQRFVKLLSCRSRISLVRQNHGDRWSLKEPSPMPWKPLQVTISTLNCIQKQTGNRCRLQIINAHGCIKCGHYCSISGLVAAFMWSSRAVKLQHSIMRQPKHKWQSEGLPILGIKHTKWTCAKIILAKAATWSWSSSCETVMVPKLCTGLKWRSATPSKTKSEKKRSRGPSI